MSDVKKFLDYDGVQHLWSRVNMQDYPNNDTLIAVLNAIDETKLDKSVFEEYTGTTVSLIEPKDDDIPKVYIDGIIPSTKDDREAILTYKSKTDIFTAYITIKCQGTSSMSYPKKNFTIKLFKDANRSVKLKKNFRGWGEQNKFCLKANWIDFSHARNIGCARLWSELVKSRDGYENYPEELRTSPNQGAVDGFPFLLYCNGHYWGRYTWNIPKDGWMANMDDELETHCILCSEDYNSSCFQAEAVIDGTDWTDELHDTVPDSILTRWNEVIDFVRTSSDDDFIANLQSYFDVESLIDYYIFSYIICHLDGLGKNQLFFTYDGQIWIASAYDMDSTIGLYWDGASFVSTSYKMQTQYETGVNGTSNLLYERLGSLFKEEIKSRWEVLKLDILSKYNMITLFEDFCDIIPYDVMTYDYNNNTGMGTFTGIPSITDNNIAQIREYLVNRWEYVNTVLTAEAGETILREAYVPAGESWIDTSSIDFTNGDYIEVSVDLSTCGASSAVLENILSVGSSISTWFQTGYHLYYSSGTQSLEVNAMMSDNSNSRSTITLTNTTIIIKIDSKGLYVDDGLIISNSDIVSLYNIEIGSAEGSVRSNATYNYIKVVTV